MRLALDPKALSESPDFRPFRDGIDALRLYEDASGASAAVLRYAPGASVPLHRHQGYEHVYVIAGEQLDERGAYPTGTLIVNAPGTSHRVWSPRGCLVLVVWQAPVTFLEGSGASFCDDTPSSSS